MRKHQVEPYIIAYLDVLEALPTIVYLKIKNIGPGVALNTRFTINKDINFKSRSLKKLPYFIEGVDYFPPQHEDAHFLFSFQGDTRLQIQESISLKISYQSILGEIKEHEYTLKFGEVSHFGKVTPPGTYIGLISYWLERIEKRLEKQQNEA